MNRRLRAAMVAATLATLAFPALTSAQGPMKTINLDCNGEAVTLEANLVYLWVPGHITSGGDGAVMHVVTSIFGFDKGATNESLPFGTVECVVADGPLAGTSVWGFFVPPPVPPAS